MKMKRYEKHPEEDDDEDEEELRSWGAGEAGGKRGGGRGFKLDEGKIHAKGKI